MRLFFRLLFVGIYLLSAALSGNFPAFAQTAETAPDKIDRQMQARIIESVIINLNESYIFPDTAKLMEIDLRRRLKNNEYEKFTDSREFAEQLTADLRLVSRDKHLSVQFSRREIPVRVDAETKTPEEAARYREFLRTNNYAFTRLENMPGNIGYIEFRGFVEPEFAAEKLAAAMNFVSDSDALIFDVRQNTGGEPAMVALVCSYLFGEKRVHLSDLQNRKNHVEEFWTQPTVAGIKFLDKDVYILTSGKTFSAAEEFAYDLKNLKRAVIVGDVTGGGANSGDFVRLSEHFRIFIPTERAVNPVTKTNWEGVGVAPDVKVSAEQALPTAYILALKARLEREKNPGLSQALRGLIEQNQKELDAAKKKRRNDEMIEKIEFERDCEFS